MLKQHHAELGGLLVWQVVLLKTVQQAIVQMENKVYVFAADVELDLGILLDSNN
jgi:hypothetical protein